ncbi:hypothetical protein ACEPAI_9748 [Sanghuangporus weigelae]
MRKIACESCRDKKIKCEQAPGSNTCTNCAAAKKTCSGPTHTKKWIEKQKKKAQRNKRAQNADAGDHQSEVTLLAPTVPQQTAPVALAPAPIDAQLWPMNTTQMAQISMAFGNEIVDAAGSWAHGRIIPVETAQTSTFQPFQLSPTAPIAGPSCSSVSRLLHLSRTNNSPDPPELPEVHAPL